MNNMSTGYLSRTSQSQVLLTLDSEASETKNQDTWVLLGQRHICIMWDRFSVHRHTYVFVKVKSTRLHWILSAVSRRLVCLALIIGRNITLGSYLTSIRFSSSRMETMQAMSSLNLLRENCPVLLLSKPRKAKMSTRSIKQRARTTSKKRLRARNDR